MRIITSLIIASVVGTSAVSTLNHYMGEKSEETPQQILKTLFHQDRPAALRLFERASFACMPELDKLKSKNARKFMPRMIGVALEMSGRNEKGPSADDMKAVSKDIQQLLQTISEADAIVLAKASKRIKTEKAKLMNCFVSNFTNFARQIQQKKQQPLFSGVELRGT